MNVNLKHTKNIQDKREKKKLQIHVRNLNEKNIYTLYNLSFRLSNDISNSNNSNDNDT